MADKVCTNFIDDDGLDVGCHLISKEYVLENYPNIVPWMKAPALWIWGLSYAGALGNNTSTGDKSSPVQTISSGTNWKQAAVSSGGNNGAIKNDGTLWVWGNATTGLLGTNDVVDMSSPVQTASGGTNWKQISENARAAIKTDGTLWTWGGGTGGINGDNTTANRSSPTQESTAGTTWKIVSGGFVSAAAIKTDGTLWTWGSNSDGRLGLNDIINKSTPTQQTTVGTTWRKVSVGGANIGSIRSDGTLWMAGEGYNGLNGDNTTINRSTPVQVSTGGTNWKQISVGGFDGGGGNNAAAIKTDGSLWIWGCNVNGNLGDNTIVNRSTPTQTVSGGTNWFNVAVGSGNIAATKTDGTLWVWGYNSGGRLGDNTTVNRSSPVQTISGGTGWRSPFAGRRNVGAIRDEGEF